MLEHYDYDEKSPSCLINRKTGKSVGCVGNHGYYQVNTKKFGWYLAHRIVLELHNGPIPTGMFIDHIDRVRTNNRIDNLRLVTPSENSWNSGAHVDNAVGEKNISRHQKGFAVEVMRNGIRIRKTTKTLEEAIKLRDTIVEGVDD